MTLDVVVVVEGRGEVEAVPVLLRRMAAAVSPGLHLRVRTIRRNRQSVVRSPDFEETIQMAAQRIAPDGLILVLLDADRDCPAELAPELLQRAIRSRSDRNIRVVLAKCEYEAWFLAAAHSVAGKCNLGASISSPSNPEGVRDAKGWLSARMVSNKRYRPPKDQVSLTACFDLAAARSAPSFDKLWRDLTSEFNRFRKSTE